jgi:hypothetical protein
MLIMAVCMMCSACGRWEMIDAVASFFWANQEKWGEVYWVLSAELRLDGRREEPLSKKYQSSVAYDILLTDKYVSLICF